MARPTNAEQATKKRELSEKQLAYVVWAATPSGIRQPDTQEKFCQIMGINYTTAWRWSKDPRVLDAIRFVVLQNAGDPGRVNDILDMLYEKAKADKDLKAAEIWLKSTGVMNQFTRGNSILDSLNEDNTFADFSTEELERLQAELDAQKAETQTMQRAKEMISESADSSGPRPMVGPSGTTDGGK